MKNPAPPVGENRSQISRERVMADLAALAADAEALLRATAEDVSDKAKETRARLAAALEKTKTTYQEYQAQGVESAQAALNRADETIRAHPYQSIGVAFGIGILLGVIFGKK